MSIPTFMDGEFAFAYGGTPASYVSGGLRAFVMDERISEDIPRFFGLARISGKVRVVESEAPSRIVRLYHRDSGVMIKSAQTDLNGDYRFDHLDGTQTYFVIALDNPTYIYDPIISPLVDLAA